MLSFVEASTPPAIAELVKTPILIPNNDYPIEQEIFLEKGLIEAKEKCDSVSEHISEFYELHRNVRAIIKVNRTAKEIASDIQKILKNKKSAIENNDEFLDPLEVIYKICLENNLQELAEETSKLINSYQDDVPVKKSNLVDYADKLKTTFSDESKVFISRSHTLSSTFNYYIENNNLILRDKKSRLVESFALSRIDDLVKASHKNCSDRQLRENRKIIGQQIRHYFRSFIVNDILESSWGIANFTETARTVDETSALLLGRVILARKRKDLYYLKEHSSELKDFFESKLHGIKAIIDHIHNGNTESIKYAHKIGDQITNLYDTKYDFTSFRKSIQIIAGLAIIQRYQAKRIKEIDKDKSISDEERIANKRRLILDFANAFRELRDFWDRSSFTYKDEVLRNLDQLCKVVNFNKPKKIKNLDVNSFNTKQFLKVTNSCLNFMYQYITDIQEIIYQYSDDDKINLDLVWEDKSKVQLSTESQDTELNKYENSESSWSKIIAFFKIPTTEILRKFVSVQESRVMTRQQAKTLQAVNALQTPVELDKLVKLTNSSSVFFGVFNTDVVNKEDEPMNLDLVAGTVIDVDMMRGSEESKEVLRILLEELAFDKKADFTYIEITASQVGQAVHGGIKSYVQREMAQISSIEEDNTVDQEVFTSLSMQFDAIRAHEKTKIGDLGLPTRAKVVSLLVRGGPYPNKAYDSYLKLGCVDTEKIVFMEDEDPLTGQIVKTPYRLLLWEAVSVDRALCQAMNPNPIVA
jgi:hypothetical protein